MNTNSSRKSPTPDLSNYRVSGYTPGAGIACRALWYIVNALVFMNPLMPFYALKRQLLRVFGAKIGRGVIIKPRVNIKHPWRLAIGDHSWIGENTWIDNLAAVTIGRNVCISQGVLLLTGNHNYKDSAFSLMVQPICIEDGVWVGARSTVGPGVTVARNTVITVGSILTKSTTPDSVYIGNPAHLIRPRNMKSSAPERKEII